MAKNQVNNSGDGFDAINFDTMDSDTLRRLHRVAALQRTSLHKLQHQGIKVGHLLSILNMATGTLSTLRAGGQAARPYDPTAGEGWKYDAEHRKYEGGADAALDSLIAGTSMRLLAIVEDESEWEKINSDRLAENLLEWSELEKVRTSMEASCAKAQRRPSVLHATEVFNGPRNLWYACMVPFTQNMNSAVPVVGVGTSPAAALEDFDRAFMTGDLNPAAELFIKEIVDEDKREAARIKRRKAEKNKEEE